MFLYERLIGIITYVSLMFIICYLIQDDRINYKIILKIYLIILSILAFFYIPPETEDLYRIFIMVNQIKSMDFLSFSHILTETSYPIALFFYYVIGRIGIYGLIPGITTFITFSNIFAILKICKEKYNINNKQFSLIFIFTMSTGMFGYLVTNIRALMALSILARCFVVEFILEKKIIKNLIYYLVSIFIHPLSIFVLGIRIVYNLLFEKNTKIVAKLFVIFTLIISFIVFKNYFEFAYNKFLGYFLEGNYFWIFEFIKILILDLFIIISIIKIKKENKLTKFTLVGEKNIANLISIFIFLIFVLTEFNIYMRVSYFLGIIIIPILCHLIKGNKKINNIIIFVSLLLLVVSCSRGHLSSFKFLLFN